MSDAAGGWARVGDLVVADGFAPLLRLIGLNGEAVAIGGRVYPRRSLWRCAWWEVERPFNREAWVLVERLRLVRRG